MNCFARSVQRIGTALGAIGTVALIAIVGIVMANIVLRFFGRAMLGTFEAVELLIVVMASFSIGYCAIKQSHVFVSIVIIRIPKRLQVILSIITTALGLGIWGLIIWCSAIFARQQWLKGEATDIMMWPVYPMRYVFIIGAIIVCLALLLELFRAIRALNTK